MSSVLAALRRISFDGDTLRFSLIESTYQPMISFFHMTDIVKTHPELKGVPDYASAIAIELHAAPYVEDFIRIKFRNGTSTDNFETLTPFGLRGYIPLTEFIYRLEVRSRIPIPKLSIILISNLLPELRHQLYPRVG